MKRSLLLLVFFLIPALASAQQISNLFQLISAAYFLVSLLIPIVAGIVLLVFFWGLAKFVLHADDEGAREEGRRLMFWGVIALFVMISVWGIVYFIGANLGIGQGGVLQSGLF